MGEESKAGETQAQVLTSRGISPWWLFLVVVLIVVAGWLGWQAVVLKQDVNALHDELAQLQSETEQLRLRAETVGGQNAALATELVPVIEEWTKIAQVQVDSGNKAGAQASVERAVKFLAMAEGLDAGVALEEAKAALDQVKATLAGEEAGKGDTETPPGEGATP